MDGSQEKKKPVITHVMADGRRLEELKGSSVPCNEQTKTAYRIIRELESNTEKQV